MPKGSMCDWHFSSSCTKYHPTSHNKKRENGNQNRLWYVRRISSVINSTKNKMEYIMVAKRWYSLARTHQAQSIYNCTMTKQQAWGTESKYSREYSTKGVIQSNHGRKRIDKKQSLSFSSRKRNYWLQVTPLVVWCHLKSSIRLQSFNTC